MKFMSSKTIKAVSVLLLLVIVVCVIPVDLVYAANTKLMTIEFEEEVDGRNRQKTITIPYLTNIVNVSSDNGKVEYSVDGDKVTLYVSEGSPSKSVLNEKKYSKTVTDYTVSDNREFSDTKNYDKDGYKGVLSKDGEPKVIEGSFIPSDTKTVTDTRRTKQGESVDTLPDYIEYNVDGYEGILEKDGPATLISGEEGGTKTVTSKIGPQLNTNFPSTKEYNEEGYSGVLTKDGDYYQDGNTEDKKIVQDSRTSNKNEFENSIPYSKDGYSGTLTKDGESFVISGNYVPEDNKVVTDTRRTTAGESANTLPKEIPYNLSGYTGVLLPKGGAKVIGGYPAHTATIEGSIQDESFRTRKEEGPDSVPYAKDGYSGILYKTSTTYEKIPEALEIEVEGTHFSTQPNIEMDQEEMFQEARNLLESPPHNMTGLVWSRYEWNGAEEGPGVYEKDGKTYQYMRKSKIFILVDGYRFTSHYRGEVSRPDTRVWEQLYEGIVTKPAIDTRKWRQDYRGEVSKPIPLYSQNYKGVVTKPDTRVFEQKYSGIVVKPEEDNRVWRQDYSGTVYKSGYDDYFKYVVTIKYTDNSSPILNISNKDKNKTINEDGYFSISGTISDIDSNQTIVISATIDGITKTKSFSSPLNNQPWSLTWNGEELKDGNYSNIVITATDSFGSSDSEIYTGILTVDKKVPTITINDYIKTPTNKDITVSAKVDKGTLNKTSHTFTENGSFTFVAIDEAGNRAEKTVTITNIDKVSPTLELTQNPETPTNKNVVITAKANDVGSGIKEIELPDGIKVFKSEATFIASKNGTYTFKAIDKAENEIIKSITVSNINKMAPVITIEPYNKNWTNEDIVVSAKVDKGTLNKTSYTFTENSSFEFVATDEAGNVTKKVVVITNIDKTPPSKPQIHKLRNNLILAPGIDNESGIDKHVYSINNGEWTVWNENINISNLPDDENTIKVKAIDRAGNESAIDIFTFTNMGNNNGEDEKDNSKLKNVELAVKLAEATRRDPYIERAEELVYGLEDGPKKDEYLERLAKLRKDREVDAELAVKLAEATKREPYIQRAKDKVAILKSGTLKDFLEMRLFELKKLLNSNSELALKNAERIVSLAESLKRRTNLMSAKEAISKLKPSEEKVEFLIRLERVAREIENKEFTNHDIAVIKATYYVELAETYDYEFILRKAVELVKFLKDCPEKHELLDRLSSLTDEL